MTAHRMTLKEKKHIKDGLNKLINRQKYRIKYPFTQEELEQVYYDCIDPIELELIQKLEERGRETGTRWLQKAERISFDVGDNRTIICDVKTPDNKGVLCPTSKFIPKCRVGGQSNHVNTFQAYISHEKEIYEEMNLAAGALEYTVNKCNSPGQIQQLLPEVTSFLWHDSKEVIANRQRKSRMPEGIKNPNWSYHKDNGDIVQYVDALPRAREMLALSLLLPNEPRNGYMKVY